MKYNYQARTKKGEIHTGSIEASSKDGAITLLRERGLYPTLLEEAVVPVYAKKIDFFERISAKEKVSFSRQLSIMFKSKVPLIESLRVLSGQIKNPAFKEKIFKISEDVEGGIAFSQALSRYPKIFSVFYISMVKSGEASGKLSEVLSYLADHLERDFHLKSKIKGAMTYPALIIFVIILVIVLMVFFLLPNLIEVLEETGAVLPLSTRIIIALTDILRKWWWLFLIILGLAVFSVLKYYSTREGKSFFDRIFLKIPVIGPFLQMIYLSRFSENLSTLVAGGLPIAQSLEIVANIVANDSYQQAILKSRDGVRKGEMISFTLSQDTDIFPPFFIQMIFVGERTGTLSSTLKNIVDFYRLEIERTMDNLLRIIEPVLIIFLGFIVGGLMLSILMPLYSTIAF